MDQKKYSLTWHTYSDHLRSMIKELMTTDDFADVTLVTEDKKYIKGHKNILSLCSPAIREMLQKERNSNPIIFLRGINFQEMESIMQFIYLGEATFYEERTDEFLAVAKSLEIKGLCKSSEAGEPDEEPSPGDQKTTNAKLGEKADFLSDKRKIEVPKERKAFGVDSRYDCDQCNKTYSRSGALSAHKKQVHQGVKFVCDQCDYHATQKNTLTVHIQSKHQGIKYACDQCDYHATQKNQLTLHIQSKHQGIKYICDHCDLQFALQSSLTQHIQSKHEGVKYTCDQCDHQATQQSNLTRHIQSKHQGVKYACEQCDYQVARKEHLSVHIQSKHEGINYVCDQCDYQARTQKSLTHHIQSKHEGFRYACDQCNFKTSWKTTLKNHIEANHLMLMIP